MSQDVTSHTPMMAQYLRIKSDHPDTLLAHPADRLRFGTDSPWTDQAASLERLGQLHLPVELLARITGANGRHLLGD